MFSQENIEKFQIVSAVLLIVAGTSKDNGENRFILKLKDHPVQSEFLVVTYTVKQKAQKDLGYFVYAISVVLILESCFICIALLISGCKQISQLSGTSPFGKTVKLNG